MTKDVIVSIKGTQFIDTSTDEPLELVTKGTYYKKNGKHYVFYDELIDGTQGVTKNSLKFDDSSFMLTRSGAINTSMLFEKERRSVSNYQTPLGALTIGINASRLSVKEEENIVSAHIDYAIDINYEYVADCAISLKIQSSGKKSNDNN